MSEPYKPATKEELCRVITELVGTFGGEPVPAHFTLVYTDAVGHLALYTTDPRGPKPAIKYAAGALGPWKS